MCLGKHGGVEVLGVYESIPTGQGGLCMGAGWEDLGPVAKGLECHGKDFSQAAMGSRGRGCGEGSWKVNVMSKAVIFKGWRGWKGGSEELVLRLYREETEPGQEPSEASRVVAGEAIGLGAGRRLGKGGRGGVGDHHWDKEEEGDKSAWTH